MVLIEHGNVVEALALAETKSFAVSVGYHRELLSESATSEKAGQDGEQRREGRLQPRGATAQE